MTSSTGSERPFISIITPSFNYARYLPAAVNSVRAAGMTNVEHVIWDGGSSDGTIQYLESLGDKVHWDSGADAGQSDALNRALSMAGGEYIGWLNSDDFYMPHAIQRATAFLEMNPQYDAVHGDTALVDADGRLIQMLFGYDVPYAVLAGRGCVIASTTTFFRRSALADVPWDTSLRYIMDWDLYLGLLRGGHRIGYLPEILAGMRIHEDQVSAGRKGRDTPEHRQVREKHALGWRGSLPGRLAGDVAHKVIKTVETKRSGRQQIRDRSIRLLDGDGNVVRESFAELQSQVYPRRSHSLPSTGPDA
jgi:glycosyltransferase involved in cell wall biosynthesis